MKTKKNERGMALIEVLVFFSISMMGLAGMGGLAVTANTLSAKVPMAMKLAQDRIEYINGLNFSAIDSAAGTEKYVSNSAHKLFSRTTTVATNPSNSDIKNVMVTVKWRSSLHGVTMSAIIINEGI